MVAATHSLVWVFLCTCVNVSVEEISRKMSRLKCMTNLHCNTYS